MAERQETRGVSVYFFVWQKHGIFHHLGNLIYSFPPFNIYIYMPPFYSSFGECASRPHMSATRYGFLFSSSERKPLTFYDTSSKKRNEKYLKVATRLTDGGHPMTKEVSRDLPAEPSATSSIPVDSQSSEMRTLSFNLKWPPERALAISSKSLKRNKCRSRLCNPCF